MTTEKHDPWALLREARDSVALDVEAAGNSRFASEDERVSGLLDRIDAALTEHDAREATFRRERDDAVLAAIVARGG